jgi:hypothetical protein
MEENLSYCGLVCQTCAIYLATREQDKEKRQKMRLNIARQIEEHYGGAFKPEDVTDCDGCKTESGRLFSGSRNCEIRKCAKGKAIDNCAHCSKYACDKLQEFFVKDQEARERLDEVKSQL